jgi:hypothetical protein
MQTAIVSDSVRKVFPTGRALSVILSKVSQGMSASALVESPTIPAEAAVVFLPQFSIRDYNGSETVNRIVWDGESGRTVRFVAVGETVAFTWSIFDSNLEDLSGEVKISVTAAGTVQMTGEVPPLEADTSSFDASNLQIKTTEPVNDDAIRRLLKHTVSEGNTETFQLVELLQPAVKEVVKAASMRVYREINGVDDAAPGRHIIDEIERDAVADGLALGSENKSDSVVIRLIRRVAGTDLTVRKSLFVVMARAIRSGAESEVRRHIGDPHLGRVIRRLARQLKNLEGDATADAPKVLEVYKQKFPERGVGIGRVHDALTAGSTANSQTVSVGVENLELGGAL